MRIKKIILFFVGTLFCSCEMINGKDLNTICYSIVEYYKLPYEVRIAFNPNENKIINLDSMYVTCLYSNTSIIGLKKGKNKINIGGEKFYFKWNENKESLPYILKDKILYVPYSEETIFSPWNREAYKFKVFDLQKYLVY